MDDQAVVKIMQALGLNYDPAISATKALENRIASLNKQLFDFKGNATAYARDINQTFAAQLGGLGDKGGLNNINSKNVILDQYGNVLKKVKGIREEISETASKPIKPITIPTPDDKNFNLWQSEWQRRTQWFLSGTLFYGAVDAAKSAISTISDVEMGMVEIGRVMEDTSFNFNNYRDELLRFATEYGQNFNTVQDIALRWAQAGYNASDSLELTRTALLALNTAELDAANATESMIGIMSQWQLSTAELPLLLDKINKTADDFTVTSQDLVDGLLRSSGAAKIMGLSIDQLISLLTIMRESSGRTGREVGNALNSILSYVQRPISIKTFEGLGIKVFADEAKTQFRNVMDIFSDVAAKWGNLSADIQDGFVQSADDAGLFSEELAAAIGVQNQWNDLQQRDLSQAAAGVYRRNYFIGMIERMSGAQQVLNGLTDAAGYSQSENARTMDTLDKKYKSLVASAEQLAVSLGDSGMTAIFKSLADGGIAVLGIIQALPKPIKDGVLAFTGMFAVLKLSQTALQMFGITAGATAASSKAAATAMGEMAAAATATAAATNTAKVASKGFMAANQWFLIISLVASAISVLVGAITRATEEEKKFIETTKQDIENLSLQKQGLQELAREYEALKSKQDAMTATADEKLRLLQIQKDLVSLYGVSITGIDSEGQAYSDSVEFINLRVKAIEDEIAAEKELLELKIRDRDANNVKNLDKQISKREDAFNQLIRWQTALDAAGETSLGQKFVIVDDIGYSENVATEKILHYKTIMKESNDQIKAIAVERHQLLKGDAETLIKELEKNGAKISDSSRAFASEFAKALAIEPKDIDTQKNALTEFVNSLNDSDFDEVIKKYNDFKARGNTGGVDATSQAIMGLVRTFSQGKPELDNFVLTMEKVFGDSSSISNAALGDTIPTFTANMDELSKSFSDTASKISGLNNVILELNKGNSISAEKVAELIIAYPQLVGHIKATADGYTIEASALEMLRIARIDEHKQALAAQMGITEASKTQLAARLSVYGIELSAIKTLEDARVAALNIISPPENLRGRIPDSQFEYYENLRKSLFDYGKALDFIASLEDKLKNPSFGVTKSKPSSKTNPELDKAIKQLEHRKRITEETVKSIQEEIQELNRLNALYSSKMSADEKMDMAERIYDAEKRLLDRRLRDSINWINEKKALDQLSADEEIAAWTRVLNNQKNNIQAVKEATVNLYKLKKELQEKEVKDSKKYIKGIQDEIKDAYKERLNLIDKEIAQINEQRKLLDRAEDTRDYNKTIEELQNELAYWSVRTSEEARRKVLEINQKIAEAQHDREVELQKQSLDDKKDLLEKEKEDWQKALDAMEDIFSDHNIDILAIARVTSKAAYEEWEKNYIQPMRDALASGNLSGFKVSVETATGTVHDWGMSDEDYNSFISNGNKWKELKTSGGSVEEMQRLKEENDKLRRKYGRDPARGEYPTFHGGGKVIADGALVAKKGEIIFPPDLSGVVERFMNTLNKGSGHIYSGPSSPPIPASADNRRYIQVDKAVNIEHYHANDEVDSELFSRQIGREIKKLI